MQQIIPTARTVIMPNGLRVNWWNVSHVKVSKQEEKYQLEFQWKYKASIKKVQTYLTNIPDSSGIRQYFKRFNIVPINEETYVNLSKILYIEELEDIPGPIKKIRVHIVFENGYEIIEKVKQQFWDWWVSNHA